MRQRGWERIALFSLFFQPGGVDVIPWGQAFQDLQGGRMNELGWGGLFPFVWRSQEDLHPPGSHIYVLFTLHIIHIYIYMYMYIYTYICVSIYICAHIYTYLYIYVYLNQNTLAG